MAWDRRTGEPRHRAIVWQDRRTAARCDELADAGHLAAGPRDAPAWCSTRTSPARKLEWLLDRGRRCEAATDLAVGTIDSWLLWKLTGGEVHATEPSNASRTMLFDIRDARLVRRAVRPVRRARVAPCPRSGRRAGRFGVTAGGVGAAGRHPDLRHRRRPAGRAVRPGLLRAGHDQEHLRHRLVRAHERRHRLPRAGRRPAHHRRVEPRRRSSRAAPTYAFEGAIFSTGSAVQWLRDGLGIIDDAAEIGPLAASVPDTDGVFFVPGLHRPRQPVVGPLRPRHASSASPGAPPGPTWPGPSSSRWPSRPATWSTPCPRRPGTRSPALRVDGGASVMDLLLQLQADQLRSRWPGPRSRRPPRSAPPTWPAWPRACGRRPTTSTANWALDVEVATAAPTAPRPTPPTPRGSGPSSAAEAGPPSSTERGRPSAAAGVGPLDEVDQAGVDDAGQRRHLAPLPGPERRTRRGRPPGPARPPAAGPRPRRRDRWRPWPSTPMPGCRRRRPPARRPAGRRRRRRAPSPASRSSTAAHGAAQHPPPVGHDALEQLVARRAPRRGWPRSPGRRPGDRGWRRRPGGRPRRRRRRPGRISLDQQVDERRRRGAATTSSSTARPPPRLEDLDADHVAPHRADAAGHRAQRAGTVGQPDADHVALHGPWRAPYGGSCERTVSRRRRAACDPRLGRS